MDQLEQPEQPTRSTTAVPDGGGAIRPDQYLVVYGPLGIGWAVTLAICAVLWRDRNTQRREFVAAIAAKDAQLERQATVAAAETERRDRECREERDEYRTTMAALAREQSETTRAVNEKWHDHARELRGALESASRKIGRRGEY
jgi:hypothetical protein